MSIVPTIKAHVNPELIHHAAIRGILNTRYIEQWRTRCWPSLEEVRLEPWNYFNHLPPSGT